jgi:hypothetical protein
VPNVLRFSGRVEDAGGVAGVALTFRRVTAAAGPAAAPTCSFLDADARRLVSRPCSQPPVLRATVAGGAWSWSTPSTAAIAPGSWELTVTATDRTGNAASGVLHFTVT